MRIDSDSPEYLARCFRDRDLPALRGRWKIPGVKGIRKDSVSIIRSLHLVLPEGAVLCFGGCGSAPEPIEDFIEARAPKKRLSYHQYRCMEADFDSSGPVRFRRAKPMDLHMLATRENLEGLGALMEQLQTRFIGDFIGAYTMDKILVRGDDYADSWMYLSGEIPEEKIREFERAAGTSVEWCEPITLTE